MSAQQNPGAQTLSVPISVSPVTAPKRSPKSSETSPHIIKPLLFQDRAVSCLIKPNIDEAFALIEAVAKLYFPTATISKLQIVLIEQLQIPLYTLSSSEERAFINFYGLPTNRLKCNKAISLNYLQKCVEKLREIFGPSPQKEKMPASKQESHVISRHESHVPYLNVPSIPTSLMNPPTQKTEAPGKSSRRKSSVRNRSVHIDVLRSQLKRMEEKHEATMRRDGIHSPTTIPRDGIPSPVESGSDRSTPISTPVSTPTPSEDFSRDSDNSSPACLPRHKRLEDTVSFLLNRAQKATK